VGYSIPPQKIHKKNIFTSAVASDSPSDQHLAVVHDQHTDSDLNSFGNSHVFQEK
jgi:hypothetical protein